MERQYSRTSFAKKVMGKLRLNAMALLGVGSLPPRYSQVLLCRQLLELFAHTFDHLSIFYS